MSSFNAGPKDDVLILFIQIIRNVNTLTPLDSSSQEDRKDHHQTQRYEEESYVEEHEIDSLWCGLKESRSEREASHF
jgi:hypothetical protein